jgi:uncharacterized repeat protein (TIGR03803 family)
MKSKVSRSLYLILLLAGFVLFTSLAGAQVFTVLFTFSDMSQGFEPVGPLALDPAGNLYGMATYGGGSGNFGTVYKLDTQGNLTVLHTFTGTPDGWWPVWGPVVDKTGAHIYGTTPRGGRTNRACGGQCGVIFKLTQAGKETVIYRFGRDNALFGSFPQFGIIRDEAGGLSGTATFGGPADQGTVFRLAKGKYTVLHTFPIGQGDGEYPQGPLLRDAAGNLYGTTGFGGALGHGTVYKIDPAGNETILYNFTGGADGDQPWSSLVQDSAGNLYGTTFSSLFPGNPGVIFKLDANGKLTVLYTFTGGADGAHSDGLIRDAAGNLYGTTGFLGTGGTLFKLDPSGVKTVLHTFTGGADGAGPGPLVQDAAGNIYGAATGGGNLNCNPSGCGVIFKLKP